MCKKYEDLREIYQRGKISSRSLCDSHKDLSARLLKAVRLLVDEKVARQAEKCKLEIITEENNKLKSEKVKLEFKLCWFLFLLFAGHFIKKDYMFVKRS